MKYTCKNCCNIMQDFTSCPICGKEEEVVPIEITIDSNVKTFDLGNQ
ncbi:hypothetical protein [Bacillus sp. Marseille-P3661]|nr:hypothetical protein [Bacillus sp. Marseille-P3661]